MIMHYIGVMIKIKFKRDKILDDNSIVKSINLSLKQASQGQLRRIA